MKSKRQIVLDTETTGLDPSLGHRIVEVALIELIDGKPTGEIFHQTVNPERDIPAEVVAIHGIDNNAVVGKPPFKAVFEPLTQFVLASRMDTELVGHNLSFDMQFLNYEFDLSEAGFILSDLPNVVAMTCTRELSKKLWPRERRHRLDDVLDRLKIDRTGRVLHGALLDAQLCMEAFIQMRFMGG